MNKYFDALCLHCGCVTAHLPQHFPDGESLAFCVRCGTEGNGWQIPMALIFVDVEAGLDSPCPGMGFTGMTEFGAVEYETERWFHGKPHEDTKGVMDGWFVTFMYFEDWLKEFRGKPVFISDNPAYDWQWINYWFHQALRRNPFGHSARRIGDFYAGLRGDFHKSNEWKKLRTIPHDHNPVNDAMGNLKAFKRMLAGER